jgi:hypothetical protein
MMKYLSMAKYPLCVGYSGGLGTVAKIGDWGLFGGETFIYIPVFAVICLSIPQQCKFLTTAFTIAYKLLYSAA